MKNMIYISNEQKRSLEVAISVNLSMRGETALYPKIIFSPQNIQNEYAVIFVDSRTTISPIIGFNAEILKHISVQVFAERVVCHYYRAVGNITDVMPNNFVNRISQKDYVKKNLYLEAVNSKKNKILLRNIPRTELLDLSFICRLNVSGLIQNGCIGERNMIVNNELLKIMGLSADELFDYAKNCELNTYRAILLTEPGFTPIYLIRNKFGAYGGAAIASMDVLVGLSDFLKSNLYILLQSIHELLIMPVDEDIKIPIMTFAKALASGIPCSDDFLSDHLYLYDKVEKKIRVVDA